MDIPAGVACNGREQNMRHWLARTILASLLACMAASSTGCVGMLVSHQQHNTYDSPAIYAQPGVDSVFVSSSSTQVVMTAGRLRELWGAPQTVAPDPQHPGSEVWTYRFGRFWCGIVPCVVIPLPLVGPFATKQACFVIQDGQVIRADVTGRTMSGGVFALLGPDGPGWY